MKILFDHQAFDLQTHGGVSRCFVELYKNLPDGVEAEMSIVETDNVYLESFGFKPNGYTRNSFCPWLPKPLHKFFFKLCYHLGTGQPQKWDKNPRINDDHSLQTIKNGDFDIFHPTFFEDYYLEAIGDKPFVLTVHDMIPELYPQYYDQNGRQIVMKKKLIPLANHIVAVSQQTKRDIVRLLGVDENKISVVYHGAEDGEYVPGKDCMNDQPYILYVGARSLYKNFIPFVKAAAPLLQKNKTLKVVCTGRPFDVEELTLFKELGLEDRFVQMFVPSDQELFDLYHYAQCFVYTSEYEGFGIPILEAWKTGCPVMLNDIPVFREVADEAAVYFTLSETQSDFVEQYENMQMKRVALVEAQNERLKLFSWKKAAKQLAEVYEKVLNESKCKYS